MLDKLDVDKVLSELELCDEELEKKSLAYSHPSVAETRYGGPAYGIEGSNVKSMASEPLVFSGTTAFPISIAVDEKMIPDPSPSGSDLSVLAGSFRDMATCS